MATSHSSVNCPVPLTPEHPHLLNIGAHVSCTVCDAQQANGVTVDATTSKQAWADRLGVTRSAVRRHMEHGDRTGTEDKPAATPRQSKDDWQTGVTFDPLTGVPTEIRTPPMNEIVGTDYKDIIAAMNVILP